MTIIQKNTVPLISYTLQTESGELIAKQEQIFYLHGYGKLLMGMERLLQGKSAGEQLEETIDPEQAFGTYVEEEALLTVDREQFGVHFDQLREGMGVPTTDDTGKDMVLYVKQKHNGYVKLSQNHPLAGVPLIFCATIVQVRNAVLEEIVSQQAHGINGDEPPSSCSCC